MFYQSYTLAQESFLPEIRYYFQGIKGWFTPVSPFKPNLQSPFKAKPAPQKTKPPPLLMRDCFPDGPTRT